MIEQFEWLLRHGHYYYPHIIGNYLQSLLQQKNSASLRLL